MLKTNTTVTPDLDLVYKKWEQRAPTSAPTSKPKEVTGQLTSRILCEGRQRWTDKFGDSVRPVRHRKVRERRRATSASTVSVSSRLIAQFKTTPIVTADTLRVVRPFMGQCCACLPDSKVDLISSTTASLGIRDILNVKTELRSGGWLESSFDQLVYSLRRKTIHKYPEVSLAVLTCNRVKEALQQQNEEAEEGVGQMLPGDVGAKNLLCGMQAKISNRLLRLAGWFLLKFLSYFLHSVQIHKGQLEMVQKAVARGNPVIYIPLHRSHLDYILVTFILWNYSIKAPYIAAGDNLRMPIFSSLITGLGGFFIRRKLDKKVGRKDTVYRAVLHSYMQELLKRGEALEFFIEGGRSRTGKACQPKGGLVSVVVDAQLNDIMEDAYIVPISINYEKILDGNFNHEQMGLPKVKETFIGTLKAIWRVFCSDFGSVRVEFCQPFSLKEYLLKIQPVQVSPPNSGSDLSGQESPPESPPPIHKAGSVSSLFGTDIMVEDQRHAIKQLSEHIVHTCVHATPVMCTNMLAFLLLTKHREGTSMKQLIQDFDWLRQEMKNRNRDVAFVGSSSEVTHYTCALLGTNLVQRSSTSDCDDWVEPVLSLPTVFELSYYSNTLVSAYLLESVLVCSVIYHCDIGLFVPSQSRTADVMSASTDDIMDTACEICKLLRYEFICIPPCDKLEETLLETLHHLISRELFKSRDQQMSANIDPINARMSKQFAEVCWEDEEIDGGIFQEQFIKANMERRDCVENMVFLHHVLAPFLESYLLTARQINTNLTTELPENDFLQSVHAFARTRVEQGIAGYAESAAFESIKNALKAFQDVKIIDCYYAGNIRMVEVRDHFEVRDKINNYIGLLESLQE
ncbi:glycerol-3-phosphate acyltransferase 1, mitochondrial-like [Mizuhopecten yessoensis]|uniref:Glycerol-3-phosphate acyltransferase 1, mitochondrial n=1 Tax=Mizuhopecten yessoensis TaxID=6573 RepID=A0A210QPZ1_MIZYE|nr:glycerol-3-phosphate acyltransferase 1, mitochondrial-like [Mizuhopecten yessoensis]XP_021352879.1 glycerol-3-phosphate acyltransferase 1, mitochondrial-like [Mizuhopecten yessoensis]OWF50789.1 Glycerol-3-phosphate acyltransferase 1, mitochondrial [Mizuhopecten yessoensis]